MDRCAASLILVVGDEPTERDFASKALSSAGWHIMTADYQEAALIQIKFAPALILIAFDNSALSGENLVAAIRREPSAIGRVPIVSWGSSTASPSSKQGTNVDEILPKPCASDLLVATCEKWRPEKLPEAFAGLRRAFGDAESSSLLDRFRQQLIEALDALALDRPHDLAHRVAGMAGMLGFAALGQQWLRLSEDEAVDRALLRYATRRAIVTIDQALGA